MPSPTLPDRPATGAAGSVDWPVCYEAEHLIRAQMEAFLAKNPLARRLAERMRNETGTDIFEWIDHLVLGPGQAEALRAVGYVEERVEAPGGHDRFLAAPGDDAAGAVARRRGQGRRASGGGDPAGAAGGFPDGA